MIRMLPTATSIEFSRSVTGMCLAALGYTNDGESEPFEFPKKNVVLTYARASEQ
jgi:hypothetical protein